ncbi:DNA primase [Staphylococcus equorum]|uniref:phage/plasmid primase, P4 family n=1 Tax=Staphylococcus equorum TaxID=246432 RepID=UPI000D1CB214|nr:phage/plasmid primase, P4 family [Staphylococcus equorum]PTF10537.1 DNA primase [Staphylococcus equorum]
MAITDKSKIKKFNGEKLPQELKDISHWVAWKAEPIKNKNGEVQYSKVPYNVESGFKASTTNVNDWNNYNNAVQGQSQYDGLGFVLSESADIVFLDIDGCIKDGKFIESEGAELAQQLLGTTYCEYSPSGTGVHAYFKGVLRDNKNNRNDTLGLEVYNKGRYMTVTGDLIEGSITTLCDDQEIIDNVVDAYFHDEDATNLNLSSGEGNELTTDEIIEIAINNKANGDKFTTLYEGDWTTLFGDQSSADMSFASYLAFWTNRDAEKMDEIFRQSNLYRAKWDEKRGHDTYGNITLNNAIKHCAEGYTGKKNYKYMSGTELKEHLELKGDSVRRYLIEEWEKDDKKGFKPLTISTTQCAKILNEFCSFLTITEDEDNTPLFVYKADDGIYTNSNLYISRLVGWLEPKSNEYKTNEIKFYLKRDAKTQEKTSEPYLIPVNNGIYNQKTKQLEDFTPDYVFTSKISTNYNPNAESPVIDGWDYDSWLNSIACDDVQTVKLLWQVIADTLNGNHTRGQALFFSGSGNNGKGTFQEHIRSLLGKKNVTALKVKEFDGKYAMAQLVGKTCVIGDDNAPNDYVDDGSNFKSVVTGDIVNVEDKYEKAYSDSFKCTVIQSTNGLPRFKDTTSAFYRRMLIVPFDADFNGDIENKKIKDEYIHDERVLEYVLYKALQLDFKKFDTPQKSIDALHEYKIDNDPVYEFKNEVFDNFEALKIPKAMVHAFYCDFCQKNGYKAKSNKLFQKEFKRLLNDEWETDKSRLCDHEDYHEVMGVTKNKMSILADAYGFDGKKNSKVYLHSGYNSNSYLY